jgi:hypothetical protein
MASWYSARPTEDLWGVWSSRQGPKAFATAIFGYSRSSEAAWRSRAPPRDGETRPK